MERAHLDPDAARRAPLPREPEPPSPALGLLELQRTAGNAAVAQVLRQSATDQVSERDRRFHETVAAADWAGAMHMLLDADEKWMVKRLWALDADSLRYLDDAVRREHIVNSRLRMFIHAGLRQKGADDEHAAPGGGYGELEGRATAVHNGRVAADGDNDSASYRFEITFKPDPAKVDADEIAFIQSARVTSTTDGKPSDYDNEIDWENRGVNGAERQTRTHTRVDRLADHDYGWYGVDNDGHAGRTLRPWTRGSHGSAWMRDTPSRDTPDQKFEFETAAVCRRGPDEGKVYATVTWGFTIDHAMKVVPVEPRYFNKPSLEFELAVAFWNAQASGGDPATDHQHELPSSLR